MWYDDYYDDDGDYLVPSGDDDDKFFKWYSYYYSYCYSYYYCYYHYYYYQFINNKNREAQKAQIKEELMPITWHPSRWWDQYVSEDQKKPAETLWM